MNGCKRHIALIGGAFALAFSVGCSAEDARKDEPGPGGASSMTVTGDVEGEFQGRATYTGASLQLGQFALGLTDNRSFALDLLLPVKDKTPPPEGTYAIGGGLDSDTFQATFRRFQGGSLMNPEQFSATSNAGTLKITTSSDTAVAGTFEFTAKGQDGSQIKVTDGTFHARQIGGM